MEEIREQISNLMGKGWTYVAIAEQLGVTWYTVRHWYQGRYKPRPYQPVLAALKNLEQVTPPKKRRYGPDAPQRKKEASGVSR